jgi:hypothetical protein
MRRAITRNFVLVKPCKAVRAQEARFAVIDKRLAGLDRAKSFVEWDKALVGNVTFGPC